MQMKSLCCLHFSFSLENKIKAKMLVRAYDRVTQVRLEACKALLAIWKRHLVLKERTGDSQHEELVNDVMTQLVENLQKDPAKYV